MRTALLSLLALALVGCTSRSFDRYMKSGDRYVGARKYADIDYLKALIDVAVAKNPEIPVAVHCDHGDTLQLIKDCIADGYTSVMIDGSHEPCPRKR